MTDDSRDPLLEARLREAWLTDQVNTERALWTPFVSVGMVYFAVGLAYSASVDQDSMLGAVGGVVLSFLGIVLAISAVRRLTGTFRPDLAVARDRRIRLERAEEVRALDPAGDHDTCEEASD